MGNGGWAEGGIADLHDAMARYVERGAMPGLIALVARGERVHVEVIGAKNFGDAEPLPRDAIFRIASLTKPITAVAAMILVEDGVIRLHDPVERFLPELADRKVLRRIDADIDDTVPAVRPITIEDLLTFRLGFGNIMAAPGTYPIQVAEEPLQLRTLGPPWPPTPHTPDEWIQALATLPLMYQPGERWMYNTSAQVLGVLIARAADQPLEAFMRARLFEPLGMVDTGFSFSAEQRDRMTTAYAPDPETGVLGLLDAVDDSYWSRPPVFPDASGWLLSTIDDYWAFVRMILRGGEYRGTRVLSEATVEVMTTDQLTPEQSGDPDAAIFLDGGGWGLGFAAPRAGRPDENIPGGFGWDGGTGTTWRSNRRHDVTGILFTQRAMTSPEPPQLNADFWRCAFEAIDEG